MKIVNVVACLGLVSIFALGVSISCTKNPTPSTSDTVTITKYDTLIKNDTTVLNDTIYGTKPDPTVNLYKGLLVYLPFSGNIADSSGNNNATEAVNGPVLSYDAHGYANNAFGASSGQEVIVTSNGSIQFDSAFSLSFDFEENVLKPCSFMSYVINATSYGPSFNLGTTLPTSNNFDISITDSTVGCNNL